MTEIVNQKDKTDGIAGFGVIKQETFNQQHSNFISDRTVFDPQVSNSFPQFECER